MMSHPEVIIGAPDDDFPGTGRSAIQGARKAADLALEIGKDPIAALLSERGD
jgi:hypothetical protein